MCVSCFEKEEKSFVKKNLERPQPSPNPLTQPSKPAQLARAFLSLLQPVPTRQPLPASNRFPLSMTGRTHLSSLSSSLRLEDTFMAITCIAPSSIHVFKEWKLLIRASYIKPMFPSSISLFLPSVPRLQAEELFAGAPRHRHRNSSTPAR